MESRTQAMNAKTDFSFYFLPPNFQTRYCICCLSVFLVSSKDRNLHEKRVLSLPFQPISPPFLSVVRCLQSLERPEFCRPLFLNSDVQSSFFLTGGGCKCFEMLVKCIWAWGHKMFFNRIGQHFENILVGCIRIFGETI